MPLNLILDAWIPVVTRSGRRILRPDQIADDEVLAPDWPRTDLNLACLELLIGLVFLADPPADAEEWQARRRPDGKRLRERLAPLAPAFELGGEGPRFLQDLEPLEGRPNPPDMLFIDSAGENTAKNNADLFVRRGRYGALPPALAAMALYTLQAYAPSGGAGNRTSMRGGGPLVTLVDPQGSLWDLVWANVPDGAPQGLDCLPWMHPTRTSGAGAKVTPPDDDRVAGEAFFGMPRRLRLLFEGEHVVGVIQRPYGADYLGWRHPLTPYYQQRAGEEWLPQHPRAGTFGYRHWLGVVAETDRDDGRERAACVDDYDERVPYWERETLERQPSILVGGWSMDNMKPREFVLSREPYFPLTEEQNLLLRGMISAAQNCSIVLGGALKPVLGADDLRKSELSVLVERFFFETEMPFRRRLRQLVEGQSREEVARAWLGDMRQVALAIFDEQACPGLDERQVEKINAVVAARRLLLAHFAGRTKKGREVYTALEISPQEKGDRT